MEKVAGVALLLVSMTGSGCGSGDRPPGVSLTSPSGNNRLIAVQYGRLADIYGLGADGTIVEAQSDVVIGQDILDQRPNGSDAADRSIGYDFLSPDPETLQPRVLIPRPIGSESFAELFDALDDGVRDVTAGRSGQDVRVLPHTVVPRNVGLRLTFSEPLGVTDDFFVVRNELGQVVGQKNTEAVQLLKIVGDLNDADHRGDFLPIAARIVVRENTLILDPVLLGGEGSRLSLPNNPAGLPESLDQVRANVRLAIALEGPLAIPGVFSEPDSKFVGHNNDGRLSLVRDFRSGNARDHSADVSNGFIRDPEPPRLVGQIPMLLERVDADGDGGVVVTLYKNDRIHELDLGDIVRFVDPAPGLDGDRRFATGEILVDPEDDRQRAAAQHVRVRLGRLSKTDHVVVDGETVTRTRTLEDLDPSNESGFPADLRERELWLQDHAPPVVVVCEFTAARITADKVVYGDDPLNFITFTPAPLPDLAGEPSLPNANVSPFAGAILQFTKPIDITTALPLSTFFFATRNVLDDEVILEEFVRPREIDPESFDKAKFATPHLIISRVFDENGSQSALRLQPILGFFLSDEMRPPATNAVGGGTFSALEHVLHLVGGEHGVRDYSGNSIDFQDQVGATTALTIPFTLDTRPRADGSVVFPENLVVSIARRFDSEDEDEQPSYYRPEEVAPRVGSAPAESFRLQDIFGAVRITDGIMTARPTSRVTGAVDNVNQQTPPQLGAVDSVCPGEVLATTINPFPSPIQNPLNPFGCRLQTVWREIDFNLSMTDPADFNLDVERMYWAPFTTAEISYDEFDRVSLFLGHSEFRPESCRAGAIPQFPASGIRGRFEENYVTNRVANTRAFEDRPSPHPAFVDSRLTITTGESRFDPRGVYRYLPLPEFQRPHFVWRDETLMTQGGAAGWGRDICTIGGLSTGPYLPSPFLGGLGRKVRNVGGQRAVTRGRWSNRREFNFTRGRIELDTDGSVGSIALPLLADFWVHPDDSTLPASNPFRATGFNGWQISIPIPNWPTPAFRVFSGGFAGRRSVPKVLIEPGKEKFASGGFTPAGARTRATDPSVYWVMTDFLKRRSVATAGFVDLFNPHRMPDRPVGTGDPRLGPFFVDANGVPNPPRDVLPAFEWSLEAAGGSLPDGTTLVTEFRGASRLDPAPWNFTQITACFAGAVINEAPNRVNFPLDPLKAGDAHIRKFDDRRISGAGPRNYWAYPYTRQITDYTTDLGRLTDPDYLARFAGPVESFVPGDLRYVNWRFIMENNVGVSPSTAPALESFSLVYRFEMR